MPWWRVMRNRKGGGNKVYSVLFNLRQLAVEWIAA